MNRIITIGREFGSGGRELGRRLAEALHIEYYDNEIITEIAKHTSLAEDYIQAVTEKRPHKLYPIRVGRSLLYVKNHALVQSASIFQEQSRILREMAERSDCVIVGRCAEYVLKEYHPFRIFIYADMESKLRRCRKKAPEKERLTDKEMTKQILEVDKNRSEYYSFYTGMTWGDKAHYDICINSSGMDIKTAVNILAEFI